ncbi:arachidonate 12-lipoxygenase, 12R-type isoform X1 [Oryzias melastigma]|uniref:Arachidonate 12-lipoxygenase, 12R-type-like n=1 Tax=Oryzias melastigma TaxID=30732 RepID=A0A3B3DB61_ORYME|nr:arachidonate 12-lipoxygenase, 12R-type isoform X1 [Oryzias melastigma]XP_036066677.1 arachidonate 12-lipoxygenase, 12R-type isoform X1 [Oryzias melastigma]XP_036066678.1 arachidonate 12-lipoxygenase, 12R-type isoform X1 [Oryzias melastigma]
MVDYKVTIWTEDAQPSFLLHSVYITLFGTEGESECMILRQWIHTFSKGNKSTSTVSCFKDIGEITSIKLGKSKLSLTQWLPGMVEVESPTGKVYKFPVYHWIASDNVDTFREGKAVLDKDESSETGELRKKEIQEEQRVYCWDVYKDRMPRCVKADSFLSLPQDDRSTLSSVLMTFSSDGKALLLELLAFVTSETNWKSFDDIEPMYKRHVTPASEYVFQHWKEDSFFAYQFLNGINPMVIKRIEALPENFLVADKVFQNDPVDLNTEMEKGNIFLCDYKILDKVTTNTIDGKKQYLAAPLVLLHQIEDRMMPIAIQLKQNPGQDNPVFLPSDSENDWLLAKLYVRSADFNLHELNYHLLRTHLLAEVFAVALKRNLPRVHPVYKLLVRHTRHTLQINFLARHILISEEGVFNKFAASGGEGLPHLIGKFLSNLTYKSLCIPDDIEDRGLKDVKNFYYKEDGLNLWNIMHSFVTKILGYYYTDDGVVQKDDELQNWIKEIFEHGFLKKEETGIPQKFTTVSELVKFVTMVMFTCSAQHAAVNSGQYDFYGWMPNGPSTMQEPPPTKKGEVTKARIMGALPDARTTAFNMGTVWALSTPPSDAKFLPDFKEEYFTEDGPCEEIQTFKSQLQDLSNNITKRNKTIELPYTYLDPACVEWSVDI